jgi:hypothetical protein
MKWIMAFALCLITSFADAGDYGLLQLSVSVPNANHRTNVKIKLSGKTFASISHSQNAPIKLSISSDFLAQGKNTPLSSDYGELASDCQFDFTIQYSLDGTQWVSLGTYTAPSTTVKGVLPIGLCDGEICSSNADVAKKIEVIQQQKWKVAGEAIKKWLEDSIRKEAQDLEAQRGQLEQQHSPKPNDEPLLSEIDDLTDDLSSQDMIEIEPPTLEDPNTVLEERIADAVSAGSVDTLVNQLSTEEKFYKACLAGDTTTQYYCQHYGGMGWIVAASDAISAALSVDPGAAMDKLYSHIYGTNTRSSLESRAAALADFKFKIQTAKDAKRARDIMENLASAARTGVSFTPIGDVMDMCEAITGKEFCSPQGKDLLPEQRFLAILGTIISNRSTLEPISNEIKEAIRVAFDNPEPLIKAVEKIAANSSDFDKGGITHVLFGEFEDVKGITKIKSGMHTEDAVQSLMARWDKQGVSFSLQEVDSIADIPTNRIKGTTLYRYETESGVILYKIPDDYYFNTQARSNSTVPIFVDGIKTGEIQGAKTIYPKKWGADTIADSWIDIKKNTRNTPGEIITEHKGTYNGIPVFLRTNENGVMKSGYPQINIIRKK